jgi:hypothetical protein
MPSTAELLPPVVTFTRAQRPQRASSGPTYGDPPEFHGKVYYLQVKDDQETPPEVRLTALLELARQAEDAQPDYPDSAEQTLERTSITEALYEPQLDTMSPREADDDSDQ